MDRREFVRAAGLGALSLQIVSLGVPMSAASAAASKRPFHHFTPEEGVSFAAFADSLAVGAANAGVAYFVDYQLGLNPNDCLLMAKYFNVKPPYLDFYRAGLLALNAFARARHQKRVIDLDSAQLHAVVATIAAGNPPGWEGPPAPLFYLLARSDAVDVVYGTPEGFERLGIPYMAHIAPPRAWS